jgi:hypothetical protein
VKWNENNDMKKKKIKRKMDLNDYEYINGRGWYVIDEVSGAIVANFDSEDDAREFVCDEQRCDGCGDPVYGSSAPMIHDRIWNKFAAEDALLCEDCVIDILGRPIRESDLTDCPFNDSWRRRFARARARLK